MLLFPNVNKTLIDLKNPFIKYRSTTSQQLTFLRRISRNKPKNQQKLKERKIHLGSYFFYHFNKKQMFPRCASTPLCLNHIVSRIQMVLQKLFYLFCLIYALMFMSLYKRHKKEERGNKESDRVFSIGSKTKMETDMHDLPSFLVLRKRCLDSFLCK